MSEQYWVSRAIGSEEGVYGLILVAGVIATAGSTRPTALFTLLFTVITVVVFWLAHVYSGALALHGTKREDGTVEGLRSSIRHSVRRARGMLAATALPAFVLLLGVFGVFKDTTAIWLALWTTVGSLAVLGFLAYRRRGVAWYWQLVGAAATASFGMIIIIAKAIISH